MVGLGLLGCVALVASMPQNPLQARGMYGSGHVKKNARWFCSVLSNLILQTSG